MKPNGFTLIEGIIIAIVVVALIALIFFVTFAVKGCKEVEERGLKGRDHRDLGGHRRGRARTRDRVMVDQAKSVYDLQVEAILAFLERVAAFKAESAVPFTPGFVARRVEKETGHAVRVESVTRILHDAVESSPIGDPGDEIAIIVHYGKRKDWWSRDLFWVIKRKIIHPASN
jgi:hypothetical protein